MRTALVQKIPELQQLANAVAKSIQCDIANGTPLKDLSTVIRSLAIFVDTSSATGADTVQALACSESESDANALGHVNALTARPDMSATGSASGTTALGQFLALPSPSDMSLTRNPYGGAVSITNADGHVHRLTDQADSAERARSSDADRKREERRRKKAQGIDQITCYVPLPLSEAVRRICKRLERDPALGEQLVALLESDEVARSQCPRSQFDRLRPDEDRLPYRFGSGSPLKAWIYFRSSPSPELHEQLEDINIHRANGGTDYKCTVRNGDHLKEIEALVPSDKAIIEYRWIRPGVSAIAADETATIVSTG